MPAIRISPSVASTSTITTTVNNSGIFTTPVSLSGSIVSVGYPGSSPGRSDITDIYGLITYVDQLKQNLYNMGILR